jgi:hypothetical protein
MKHTNTHNIYNPIFYWVLLFILLFEHYLVKPIHYDNTTLFTKGDTIALVATARKNSDDNKAW